MRPLFIIGPCALESREVAFAVASSLRCLFGGDGARDAEVVFKGSFTKDNRMAAASYRGPGISEGLALLRSVREEFGLRVLTDVHESAQVELVAESVDVLQIPAFLCRQTSLLEAAGSAGLPVNVKKGQFMAPDDMAGAVEKLCSAGCPEVWLTERGSFFGYHDLVVDLRSLSVMRGMADRVVLDVTHSLQLPGALGSCSGGRPALSVNLARAGAAWGTDGIFLETHPDPSSALCDASSMVPLGRLEDLVDSVLRHWEGA
ncbi:3-deoxy-8-phosphooctulonate synthase [Candidatus Fermentibacterales bacterium]|nr:3-deoxy-8-phosphooctulonate synthase [Candidatus Fermentibacterales bacterium]